MITIGPLFEPQYLPNVAGVLYTALSRTMWDKVTVANPSASTAYTCSLYWCPNGASPTAANAMVTTRQLQPLETWDCWFFVGHTMGVGDTFQGVASVATALVIFASGRTMTP